MAQPSVILIGSESLTIEAGRQMRARSYDLRAVVTLSADVRAWAEECGIKVMSFAEDLPKRIGAPVDWIFSVANLQMLPVPLLAMGRLGTVNFHDGPLPRYAGLNAPVWAILNGETQHGITWHLVEGGVDEGRILTQEMFEIRPDDTAFTLNSRCFEAAVDSFGRVLDQIETGAPDASQQDLSQRSYFGKADRPVGYGFLDHTGARSDALRLIRALDHGPYWNPLCLPNVQIAGEVINIAEAREVPGTGAPGAVLEAHDDRLTLAFADGALELTLLEGTQHPAQIGDMAQLQSIADTNAERYRKAALMDSRWRIRLGDIVPVEIPLARPTGASGWGVVPVGTGQTDHLAHALLMVAHHMTGASCDVALGVDHSAQHLSNWVPLHDMDEYEFLKKKGPFASDIALRDPALVGLKAPPLGLGPSGPVAGTIACLCGSDLHYDTAHLTTAAAELIASRIAHAADQLAQGTPHDDIAMLSPADQTLLAEWNDTDTPFETLALPQLFEAQVAKTPDAVAVVVDGDSMTYAELDGAANKAAHVLREMGIGPDVLAGLYTTRSLEMLIGALAILKVGGAYVPLDPAYPAHRIAGYLEDSAVPVIVTQSALVQGLPAHGAELLELDTDPRITAAPDQAPSPLAGPDNLAYLIFTSGSTGRPKGVMVEHRNVANFFTGMDARLSHTGGGTWLAVTSLNFDISVLELFYTLARGFKLVVTSDMGGMALSNGPAVPQMGGETGGMEFSLYYWGNDDGAGEKKYELLLEGAKFADANGFCAVWTPERHFHAFGGPYPNPSVTGAAVAAVTQNIGVRAGSCVAPLHHPARIAEEWAVIDNLTGGRAGMAIASGWQPDDFVLRPENTPPNNKAAMMESIETVRKLWRGEKVAFPKADGTQHAVITQPRPISKELPVWVTTAGNPETWKEAGRVGANVLTHLLGQSVDEVAEKITLYHAALREAGHDPAQFKVTLMLHTCVAETRDEAREVAREPMKDYLRSAAGLIKQYAWAFPAFKRPAGVDNAFQLDLGSLEADELEGILDFAFERYFNDSGLFGTIDDCMTRVDDLKAIGVSEIACLIDYGIDTARVLEGLVPLAEVVRRANAEVSLDADDMSLAAQLIRHEVTHLQCTPSMARLICADPDARAALRGVENLMIGGEALPGALVQDLQTAAPKAVITNMYGPTETTIWSSTAPATTGTGTSPLGRPIANTQFYVLGDAGQQCPIGQAGELCIGGTGVTRGYLNRPELTSERFVRAPDGGRMYKTGDLVRLTESGSLEFLGRVDHQIKLRGYRIELGEIEAALEAQTSVRQAIVTAHEFAPGDTRLVGYVTGAGLDTAALRDALRASLPVHMVPSQIDVIESFPLTPNKKVDRAALPAPRVDPPKTISLKPVVHASAPSPSRGQTAQKGTAQSGEGRSAMRPSSVTPSMPKSASAVQDVRAQVAAVWSRLLGIAEIGPNDNFFDIGGHSLLAVQTHRALRDELGAKLSITDIFRFPVLSALADQIAEKGGLAANSSVAPAQAQQEKIVSTGAARADQRADAMSKRRAMRAARGRR
jgi:natural product biosynthesis luciferase-like monooxygenase protein